jgi:rhodanese-related sulfurtransferase
VSKLRSITPEEVAGLVDEGYVYVDVRSEQEFEQGHIPGAVNVPLMHFESGRMQQNPEFLDVVRAAFDKDKKLILGCRSGSRSLRAAQLLLEEGFTNVCDMPAGWEGKRDAFGSLSPGYSKKNLPIETGQPEGRSYRDIKQRQS